MIKRGVFHHAIELQRWFDELGEHRPRFAIVEMHDGPNFFLGKNEWVFGNDLHELLDEVLQWEANDTKVYFVPPTEEDKWRDGEDACGHWELTGKIGRFFADYVQDDYLLQDELSLAQFQDQDEYKRICLEFLSNADCGLAIFEGHNELEDYIKDWLDENMAGETAISADTTSARYEGSGPEKMSVPANPAAGANFRKETFKPLALCNNLSGLPGSLYLDRCIRSELSPLFSSSTIVKIVADGFVDENGDGRSLSLSCEATLTEEHGRLWHYMMDHIAKYGLRTHDNAAVLELPHLTEVTSLSPEKIKQLSKDFPKIRVTVSRTRGPWEDPLLFAAPIPRVNGDNNQIVVTFLGPTLGLFVPTEQGRLK